MKHMIDDIVKQVLKEYLDKDYMIPLKGYLHMSDEDKAWECAGKFPWLVRDFIEYDSDVSEVIEDLIEKGEIDSDVLEMDDYEMVEVIGPLFNTVLAPYADKFIDMVSRSGDTEVPLFVVADYVRDVKNEWLIHMTDNLIGVSHEGFSIGVEIDELAYTPGRGTTKWKYGPGYNFAFTADNAKYAENTYGKYCVLFQASGVQIYHYGDNEEQVIFYGPSARNLIFIYKDEYGDYSGSWVIKSEITGRLLCHFDDLQGCVNWAIQNFPQYRDHLVGRYKQRVGFEKRRAIPDEKAWWRDKKEKIAESDNEARTGLLSRFVNLNEYVEEAKATADEVYNQYYSDIDRRVFDTAVNSDPTAKAGGIGKYTKWILNLARHGQWKIGDAVETKDCLTMFAKLGKQLPEKDIQKYTSVSQLYQALSTLQGTKTRNEIKREADKVYEDQDWMVIKPNTKEASMKYGANTRWCTAASQNNMFDYYSNKGPLYIIISKKYPAKKWQFHVETDSFMDVEDERIVSVSMLSRYGDTDGLFNFMTTVDKDLTFFPVRKLQKAIAMLEQGAPLKDAFDFVGKPSEGFVVVGINGKYNYIEVATNKLLSDTWFYEANDFRGGFGRVKYNRFEDDGYSYCDGVYYDNSEGSLGRDHSYYYDNDGLAYDFISTNGYLGLYLDDENGWLEDADDFDTELDGYAKVMLDSETNYGTMNFLSKNGELLLPKMFDFVEVTGRMIVARGSRTFQTDEEITNRNGMCYWLFNTKGELVSDKGYDYVKSINRDMTFSGYSVVGIGISPVADRNETEKKGKYNIINWDGKLMLPVWVDKVNESAHDGWTNIWYNDMANFVNNAGQLMFGTWENTDGWVKGTGEFSGGYAAISELVNANGKKTNMYNFVDQHGNIVSKQWYDKFITSFRDGVAAVGLNNKCFLINIKGEVVSPLFDSIKYYSQHASYDGFKLGFIRVMLDNKMYVWDFRKNEYLTSVPCDEIGEFELFRANRKTDVVTRAFAYVYIGNETYKMDMNGNICDYDYPDNVVIPKNGTSKKQISENLFSKYMKLI